MRSDDYLDDEIDERDRRSASALFASGWFRAALVLGVVAITLVVAVPYVLRWMESSSARVDRQVARPIEPRPTVAPPARVVAPTPVPVPVAPAESAPSAMAAPGAGPSTSAGPGTAGDPRRAPAATSPSAPSTPAQATERIVPAPVAPAREAAPSREPASPREATAPRDAAAAKATAESDSRKAEAPAKRAAHPDTAPAKVAGAAAARGGDFWVQVGAFQRERNAEALVRSIREDMKMPAQITRRARSETVAAATPRHEVFVTDAPVGAVTAALRGRGSAQAVRGGVAVQPPLELKDAVTLSRRLAGEGLSVKIRRVGGDAVAAEPATLHVVRVGGYATRAQAETAQRELVRKGFHGFVADAPTR